MDIENIQNNTIIVCENNYKKYILKELNKHKCFLNVKFFSKKDFINNYLFRYNEKAISYLVNKYQIKVNIAKMYLENIYYVDNKKYKSPKLNKLVSIKNELIENKLLIFNDNFKNYIKRFRILVIGYPYLNNAELNIFDAVNARIINDYKNYGINKVYEFETIEEEINFVCKKICKLINDGIDINRIKLAGVTSDYYNDLERIFKFYNIPIKIGDGESLYSNIIVQKFLKNYSNDLKESIELIKDENSEIVKKIIDICNKYSYESNKEKVKLLIIDDFKNIKINNFQLKNYIELVDINNPFQDEYVFLMGFNVGNIPKTLKDEDYITDDIKGELNLELISYVNKKYKEYTINKINSIKNLIITYKKKSSKQEFYPSSLISDLGLEIINENDNVYESYSKLNDKIIFAKMEDNYIKYGNITDDYFVYKNSLGNISYNTFDNKFKGIDKNDLKEYIKGKLTLSYTSLNNFNKCAFRYYLANILKLDKYEESFEAFIGSIFHDVLEKCFIYNLNVTDEVNNYIKDHNKVLSIKERFFVNKVINDINYVIDVLKEQNKHISMDKMLYEKNIVIDKSRDGVNVEFIGFVDKILYKENGNNTLVSIIDYKTGFIDIELKYVPYGLSLQLPIYLYLVKNSNLFVNPKFVGFYLQYILDKDITRTLNKSYDSQKKDNLKLMGYSLSDADYLGKFDDTFNNSEIIKGMKTKADGNFSSYSKVLNEEQIDKLIDLTEKNIDGAISDILNAKFDINPKKIGYFNDVGCKYCKFRDLCFRKEENYKILDEVENLDFLGGDKNA